LKRAIHSILICLLVGASGCASYISLGEPIDDVSRQAALIEACPSPDLSKVVFRTVIQWPGREISLVEVVKAFPDGRLSVAGVTDIGNTLYAVQIDPDGKGQVVSKSLPFSDRWLLDGLVAELLVPWNGPNQSCQLYKQPDGTRTLIRTDKRFTRMFIFDGAGCWSECRLLSNHRLVSQVSAEWDGESIPKVMRVHNRDKGYQTVRERVTSE
jgi:hypothetical protein